MKIQYKIGIAVVALLVAFAAGRFSAPVKTVVETKTTTTEDTKTQSDTDTNVHKIVTQHEVIQPNGTKIIDTTTKDDLNTQINDISNISLNSQTDSTKTTVKDSKRLNLSLLAGGSITSLSQPIFGGHISGNILGPITAGVWGLSNSTAGCSVGLSF